MWTNTDADLETKEHTTTKNETVGETNLDLYRETAAICVTFSEILQQNEAESAVAEAEDLRNKQKEACKLKERVRNRAKKQQEK